MKCYLRVIPADDAWGDDQVAAVLAELSPEVTQTKPFERHPRGGFSLFLEFPDGKQVELATWLHERGLWCCF
ncbi:MAG: hypothetical protein KDD82_01105 [Planctomycetes bacterium]|nr:hypothetical protein [Planctomycetota bacterium]